MAQNLGKIKTCLIQSVCECKSNNKICLIWLNMLVPSPNMTKCEGIFPNEMFQFVKSPCWSKKDIFFIYLLHLLPIMSVSHLCWSSCCRSELVDIHSTMLQQIKPVLWIWILFSLDLDPTVFEISDPGSVSSAEEAKSMWSDVIRYLPNMHFNIVSRGSMLNVEVFPSIKRFCVYF